MKNLLNQVKNNQGITLIALVVTIIILLILVGVTLNVTISKNGIIGYAREARFKTEVGSLKENLQIQGISTIISGKTDISFLKTQLEEQVKSLDVGIKNSEDGISLIQVGEGAISELQGILQRIKVLLVYIINSNDNFSDTDKESMKKEINQLLEAYSELIEKTKYNDSKILDGSVNKSIQFGNRYFNQGEVELILEDLHWNILYGNKDIDYDNIEESIEKIENMMKKISIVRTQIGAIQNILDLQNNYLEVLKKNIENLIIYIFGNDNGNIDKKQAVINTKSNGVIAEVLKISEWTLSSVHNCLQRLYELKIMETTQEENKTYIQEEMSKILDVIKMQLKYAGVSDIKFFDGSYTYINRKLTLEELNISNVKELTKEKITSAIEIISSIRTSIEEKQNIIDSNPNQEADSGYAFDVIYDDIDIPEKYIDKFQIIDGQLTYIGKDEEEKEWALEMQIKIMDN